MKKYIYNSSPVFFVFFLGAPDYNSKLCHMYDLVKSLPPPNHDTMELLFGHLRRYTSLFLHLIVDSLHSLRACIK